MPAQEVGGGAVGVRIIFKGRITGGAALRIGDLGDHPLHGQGPQGGFRHKCRDG